MPHLQKCPHCTKDVQIPDNAPGRQLRCPTCRKLFLVPAAPQPVGAAVGAKVAVGGDLGPKPVPPTHQGIAPKPAVAGAIVPQRPAGKSNPGTSPRPASVPMPVVIVQRPPAAPAHPPAPHTPAANKHAHGDSVQHTWRPLLESVSLAARAHKNQLRKDEKTPYVSHVFRVCLIVRHVFGVDDSSALMSAILHDTLEDTTTDWDDVKELAGEEVANNVAGLTKDKRRPEDRREEIYSGALAKSSWQVQVCKLADIFDNLMDSAHLPADKKAKTVQRCKGYLAALAPALAEQAKRPYEMVSHLVGEIDAGK